MTLLSDDEPASVEPRAQFYFDNYKRIEEWAALRSEAATALHGQLLSLAEQVLADAAGSEDVLCRTSDLDEGSYPRVVLERPAWRRAGETSAPFGIAIEWERTPIDRTGQLKLYVAVRGNTEHPRHPDVGDAVKAASATWKRELPGSWTGNSTTWPCFTWVRPNDRIDVQALWHECVALQQNLLAHVTPGLNGLLDVDN